jgi:hypothetical protein
MTTAVINVTWFLGWGETELSWYVGHKLAYCTSPD